MAGFMKWRSTKFDIINLTLSMYTVSYKRSQQYIFIFMVANFLEVSFGYVTKVKQINIFCI